MSEQWRPRFRLALLPLGIAFGVGAELARLASGWPVWWVVVDFVPGIALLGLGSMAWMRRPENRIGGLMVATGFAWYVGTYQASRVPWIDTVAYAFAGYYDALLAWLVLAYPNGRLRSLADRAVVALFLAVLVARSAFRLAVYRPTIAYDFGNPADVEQYIADLTLRDAGDSLARAAIAAVAIAIVTLIVGRLVTETRAGRRVAGPVLVGGTAFAVAMVVEFGVLSLAGSFQERTAAWDAGLVLTSSGALAVAVAFALGILRLRLGRAAVADLVVRLRGDTGPSSLRSIVADALGDPSVEVAYPVPGSSRFVDEQGRDVVMPGADASDRAVTRLERAGSTLAVLIHDPAVLEQQETLRAVASATAMAIENERLAAEVRRQLEDVQASRARIVEAGDAERRRVERDLHDGAQQRLVTLAVTMQVARNELDGQSPAAAATLERAAGELQQALAELRTLARGLHPAVLVEEGLVAAVESLADRCPRPVDTLAVPTRRYDPQVEATAYFVVAEALTNVARYAGAASATVRIEEIDGSLRVEVADDGPGGADPAAGSGLRGLEDRVAATGGTLRIESPAGVGTTVVAEIPCG